MTEDTTTPRRLLRHPLDASAKPALAVGVPGQRTRWRWPDMTIWWWVEAAT